MAYTPISQATKTGGYVPIGQRKPRYKKASPRVVANLPLPDFGTSQSTKAYAPDRPVGGKLLIPSIAKAVVQGTARGAIATGTYAGARATGQDKEQASQAKYTPISKFEKALFGKEPVSVQSEGIEPLMQFGVSEEKAKKFGAPAVIGLTVLDAFSIPGKRKLLTEAALAAKTSEKAATVLRNVKISDEIIFGFKLDQKLAKANTKTQVDTILKQAEEAVKKTPRKPEAGFKTSPEKVAADMTSDDVRVFQRILSKDKDVAVDTFQKKQVYDTIGISKLAEVTQKRFITEALEEFEKRWRGVDPTTRPGAFDIKPAKGPTPSKLPKVVKTEIEKIRVENPKLADEVQKVVRESKPEDVVEFIKKAPLEDIVVTTKPKGIIASAIENLKSPAGRQAGHIGGVPEGFPKPVRKPLSSTKDTTELPALPKLSPEVSKRLSSQQADKTINDAIRQRYTDANTRTPRGDTALAEAAKKGDSNGFKKLVGEIATPISSRLGRINPKLKTVLRKFEFQAAHRTTEDASEILPLLKGVQKMSKDDQVIFDLARKNGDTEVIEAIATKYDLHKELNRTRKVMDGIFDRAKSVGMDVQYRKDYFPRMIINPKKYMGYLRGREDWSTISQMLEEAAKKKGRMVSDLTTEEQAALINNFIRGYGNKIALAKPGFTKGRSIEVLDTELNQFYESTDSAISAYVVRMNDEIEGRRFFGKALKAEDVVGEATIENSIGSYVLDLVAKGEINPTHMDEVSDILKSRFHRGKMNGALDVYRNAEYISTMGSPISAITQIGDLAFAFYESGIYHGTKGLGKSLLSKNKITKEMVGIENVTQEFTKNTFSGKALDKTFQLTGLSKMDNIGKETLMNGYLSKLQAQAKKGDDTLTRLLESMYDADEVPGILEDLKKGVYTPETKELAFNKLLDYQPVAKSEMPQKYLEMPNGKILYMLKSFTMKQIDVFRREAIDDIVSGNAKRTAKGIKNLVRISALFVAANATADEVKDLLLGRETTMEDKLTNNLWRLVGASKYDVYKARTEGLGRTVQSRILFPTSIIDRASKDIHTIAKDREYSKGPLKGEGYKSEMTQSIPLGGKLYYWWYGRGAQKQDYKGGSSGIEGLPKLPKLGAAQSTPSLPKLPKLPKL